MVEKCQFALGDSVMGFDHENQTIHMPKIKQEIKPEVKIEPMGGNFNE